MSEPIKKSQVDELSDWASFMRPKKVYVHPDDMHLLAEAGLAEGAIPCRSVPRGKVFTLRDRR